MPVRRFIPILAAAAILTAVGIVAWWRNEAPAPAVTILTSATDCRPTATRLPLHPVVARIVNDGPLMPYLKFNYLIKEIPTDLAPHDIDALIAFVSGRQPGRFMEAEWGSLVNDIEEALTVQTIPSEKVARALSAIYRDESRTQLQRDYALQHIGGFAIYLIHAHHAPPGVAVPDFPPPAVTPLFSLLLNDLLHATSDPAKPWAGTALNLLDGILRAAESRSTRIPGLNLNSLVALALPIAENPALPLNARLPALQLAGRHRAPQAASLARSILSEPGSHLMLIQAAAAVLAQCGTQHDLPLLNARLADNQPHTRVALDHAIKSIGSPCTVR